MLSRSMGCCPCVAISEWVGEAREDVWELRDGDDLGDGDGDFEREVTIGAGSLLGVGLGVEEVEGVG